MLRAVTSLRAHQDEARRHSYLIRAQVEACQTAGMRPGVCGWVFLCPSNSIGSVVKNLLRVYTQLRLFAAIPGMLGCTRLGRLAL